jgi:hypothetical protein
LNLRVGVSEGSGISIVEMISPGLAEHQAEPPEDLSKDVVVFLALLEVDDVLIGHALKIGALVPQPIKGAAWILNVLEDAIGGIHRVSVSACQSTCKF